MVQIDRDQGRRPAGDADVGCGRRRHQATITVASAEVLDLVEYLLTKVEREAAQPEEMDWSPLSLAFAMRA